jgi:cobalt-zinc-cadmium efflux system outer membrane protein
MLPFFRFGGSIKPTYTRSFAFPSAAAWAAVSLCVSSPSHAAPPLTEAEGTRRVCSAGVDMRLARALLEQGSAEVTAVGVLPNPSLNVQHQRTASGPEERETIVGLSVPFGVSGRRGLLQQAAAARRDRAKADGAATLFESALAFREAYSLALRDQARVTILSEQQAALEASSKTIEGLAKSGEAARYDLLRQRLQARLHHAEVESARADALASRVKLEAWIEAPVELPQVDLALLANERLSASPPAGESPTPRGQGLRAASRAHAFEARAARRRWVPDPDVFAGYRVVEGTGYTAHGISLSLTLPLTFFDHGQGDAAQADAEQNIADAAAAQLERRERAEASSARARLEQLSSGLPELAQAQRDARELLVQARSLYAAGEASITEMLEAFRVAEQARLAELDRVFEIALARLLLMRASGTLFDESLDRACLHLESPEP